MSLFVRQAITARYAGPTNHRGTRVLVRASAGRMSVPWDHSLEQDENYARAIRLFAERWGWDGTWVLGQDHNQNMIATRVTDGGMFDLAAPAR